MNMGSMCVCGATRQRSVSAPYYQYRQQVLLGPPVVSKGN